MFRKIASFVFGAALGLLAESIVKNGFFDEGTPAYGALPPSWTMVKPDAGGWGFANDDGVDSASSIRFNAVKGAGILQQDIKLQPDTDYALLFWYKCDGVAPSIVIRNMKGTEFVRFSASDAKFGKWQHSRQNFRSGKDADYRLQLYGDYQEIGEGKSYFDAIEILPKAEADKRPAPSIVNNDDNIALHKKYTMLKDPDYALCKDPDDAVQLTDGGKTVGYFWTQKSTVGWHRNKPATIIVDLERTEPICGASWSCGAGTAGVLWPTSIWVFASEDKINWQLLGDLTYYGTRGKKAPDNSKYSTFTYATRAFKAKGRYVAFMVMSSGGGAVFCDEVEIYRGSDDFLKIQQKAEIVAKNGDFSDFLGKARAASMIKKRFLQDMDSITEDLKTTVGSNFASFAEKDKFLALAEKCSQEINALAVLEEVATKSSELPFDNYLLSKRILSLNSFAQHARGFKYPFVWKTNRWENVTLIGNAPDDKQDVALSITMMRGEVRAESVNILNPTDTPLTFKVEVKGLPAGSGSFT